MILRSFSKINLTLSVNKKLKLGLHDIQSYYCLINLSDKLIIKKINGHKDIVRFNGKFAKYVNKKKNTITNVLLILRKKKIINNYYSVTIYKKIPVFAGLGGGTSNAASLIKHFTKNKINKKLLENFSKIIGSDLRLFFHNQGFLKNLKEINGFKKKYKFYFLLVYPNIRSSTKYIFSKVSNYSLKLRYNINKINNIKKFVNIIAKSNNDLQIILENKYPVIKNLLKDIGHQKGCQFSRMSGSGSTCYGMFESKRTAKVALTKIKSKYPKFWFSVTKTI